MSRLFWRLEKASPFRLGKIAFSAEKAISTGSEKIPFSGRQDARNCVRVFLAPREIALFRFRNIAFSAQKANSFSFGKSAFSGRQDARNCVRVVLAPWKSFSFQIRKVSFWAEKSYFFQVRKNRFLRSPERSKLRQRCSSALQKRPLSDSDNSPFQLI